MTTTYSELRSWYPRAVRLRNTLSLLKRPLVFARSLCRSFKHRSGWIRFLFYHHVFDDEMQGFARQLDYLKKQGSFVSFDDAVSLLCSGSAVEGRHFCLSFDDGLHNCITNALPILAEKGIPCTFFVVADFIGVGLVEPRDAFGYPAPLRFLTWDDCRHLAQAGMVIGSHGLSHSTLAELTSEEAAREMRVSKQRIELELARPCYHFCAPRGKAGRHFLTERDPAIAQKLGYRSFSTTEPGMMQRGGSPYFLRRTNILAGWGDYEVRYYLLCDD